MTGANAFSKRCGGAGFRSSMPWRSRSASIRARSAAGARASRSPCECDIVCRALDISIDWLVTGRGAMEAHRPAAPESSERPAADALSASSRPAKAAGACGKPWPLSSEVAGRRRVSPTSEWRLRRGCAVAAFCTAPDAAKNWFGNLRSILSRSTIAAIGALPGPRRRRRAPRRSASGRRWGRLIVHSGEKRGNQDQAMARPNSHQHHDAGVHDRENEGSRFRRFTASEAVKTANGGAAPVVWFQTLAQVLMQTTTVSWTEQYQAYVRLSQIIPTVH